MKNKKYSVLCFAFEIIFLLAGITVRLAGGMNGVSVYVYYALLVLSALFLVISAVLNGGYAPAFKNDGKFKLSLSAYIASLGFFAEFINRCIAAYSVISGSRTYSSLLIFVLLFTALFSLLSSIYFIIAGMSFGNGRYDFRYLKLLHIAPVMWSLGRLLEIVQQAGLETNGDLSDLLRCVVLICAMCFFFAFAREVDNEGGAGKLTVIFARLFVLLCLVFFAEEAVLLHTGGVGGFNYETIFVFTAATHCIFAAAFAGNIVTNTKLTES